MNIRVCNHKGDFVILLLTVVPHDSGKKCSISPTIIIVLTKGYPARNCPIVSAWNSVNIFVSIINDESNVVFAKNNQQKHTKWNVNNMAANFFNPFE